MKYMKVTIRNLLLPSVRKNPSSDACAACKYGDHPFLAQAYRLQDIAHEQPK
jgi:hypothetical protein